MLASSSSPPPPRLPSSPPLHRASPPGRSCVTATLSNCRCSLARSGRSSRRRYTDQLLYSRSLIHAHLPRFVSSAASSNPTVLLPPLLPSPPLLLSSQDKHYKHRWAGDSKTLAICTQTGFVLRVDAVTKLMSGLPVKAPKVTEAPRRYMPSPRCLQLPSTLHTPSTLRHMLTLTLPTP